MKKTKLSRLGFDFYNQPCEELAQNMLGKIISRRLENGKIISGYIVETEAYLGGDDRASNSFNGRRTAHNVPVFMAPGTSFVYMTYGMYHCINISSQGEGAAVLIRSLEPLAGITTMVEFRTKGRKKKNVTAVELCNGPSKLCISLDINKNNANKLDMCISDILWLEEPDINSNFTQEVIKGNIIKSTRIGIESAGKEWASKLLRFYIKDNLFVSKRDKKPEEVSNKMKKL